MLGFKSFEAAQSTLTGIEWMHMLRKGQLEGDEMEGRSAAKQLYTLHIGFVRELWLKNTLRLHPVLAP
jgi:hypothetical protein